MWNLCANGAQILRAADCKPIVGNPFRGFRQTQKSLTLRRQAFLYAENRFPGDESQRGLVVIHILLVQSTSQFSSPSRRQSLPRNNPRFAPAFRTMFVALENAKTSLFLALVRKVLLLVPDIAKRVEKIITSDLRQHHPAWELAAQFSVSETSLKNYFRGVFGQNISIYLREVRMKKAAELLTSTRLSVAEIAELVGYMNQSKFASVFKKQFGLSPLEYRRSKKLENI